MKWHTGGRTIWFTGLSGSGKSTLAAMLKSLLESRGVHVVVLDGDVLRNGLNRDLGFSAMDRAENLRRAAEVAKILSNAGHTVIAAFITPLESIRAAVRGIFEEGRYMEMFLDCPLPVCEGRDVKGLYSKARAGQIAEFTGISSPFERPSAPDLAVPTGDQTVEQSLAFVMTFLENRFPDLRCDAGPVSSSGRVCTRKRVAVVGLDGVPPGLVFGERGKSLRNLRSLMDHGAWGTLKSTDPPETVPAWTTITTGKDPGELGLYGSRVRQDSAYGPSVDAASLALDVRRVWDYLEDAGRSSLLLDLPQSSPGAFHRDPSKAGLLDRDERAGENGEGEGGRHETDIKGFRVLDKDRLRKDLYSVVERRFGSALDLLRNRPWDLFLMAETGLDRLHHGFWQHYGPDHPLYTPGNPYEDVIPEFYRYVDGWMGTLMAQLSDETTLLVVSAHGSRSLLGGVGINEWLIAQGFLVLRKDPDGETLPTPDMIDWSRTKAWGEGGPSGALFINLKGREPQGIVDQSDYDSFREELARGLCAIPDEKGRSMDTRVLKPDQIYRSCKNIPPDLIVYFDNLDRRSIGTVGTGEILVSAWEAAWESANHHTEGIFIMARMEDLRNGVRNGRRVEGVSVEDITPTILHEFGLTLPPQMLGRVVTVEEPDNRRVALAPGTESRSNPLEQAKTRAHFQFSQEEGDLIKNRLMELRYL